MPVKLRRVLVLATLITMPVAHADTITLKDGSKLDGKVLREEADAYLLEVQVTKSIKDERRIPKDQVAKIEREAPHIKAFEPIAKLVPTPDALSPEEYARRIQIVERFLKENLTSSKSIDARRVLNTLKQEVAVIEAGGIKLNGRMLQPDQYRANAVEIDAGLLETSIRAQVQNGQLLGALRGFAEFDRDFRGTAGHSALLPLIQKVITSYLAEISEQLATLDSRLKQRQSGLQRMSPSDRRATESALAEEDVHMQQRLKTEKEAKIGWVTTDPYFKPALDDALNFGKQELNRLSAASAGQNIADPSQAYRDAWKAVVNAKDATAAAAAIQSARSAMVGPKYIALLEQTAAGIAAQPVPAAP